MDAPLSVDLDESVRDVEPLPAKMTPAPKGKSVAKKQPAKKKATRKPAPKKANVTNKGPTKPTGEKRKAEQNSDSELEEQKWNKEKGKKPVSGVAPPKKSKSNN